MSELTIPVKFRVTQVVRVRESDASDHDYVVTKIEPMYHLQSKFSKRRVREDQIYEVNDACTHGAPRAYDDVFCRDCGRQLKELDWFS